MRGEDVKKLQRALGFTEEKIDGIFGKKTDRAVRDFQKIHGREDTGLAHMKGIRENLARSQGIFRVIGRQAR